MSGESRRAAYREYYQRNRARILAQQKSYRVKRDGPTGPRERRMAVCHPDRPNHANGECKRCYQREWFRKYGYTPKPKKPQPVGVWPQDVVRVPVKGWGCL
jgi:hypothetical protein